MDEPRFDFLLGRTLTLPLLVLMFLAGIILFQFSRVVSDAEAVESTDEGISQIHQLQEILYDMESDLRGYALTGDRQFLTTYRWIHQNIKPSLDVLSINLRGKKTELAELNSVQRLFTSWDANVGPLQNRRIAGISGAITATESENRSMTGINLLLENLSRALEANRDKLEAGSARDKRDFEAALIFLTFVCGLGLALDSRRNVMGLFKNLTGVRGQLEVVLREVSEGIIMVDEKGRHVYINEAGKRSWDPESVSEYLKLPMEPLPEETPLPEMVLKYKDKKTGEEKWGVVKSKALWSESGETLQICILRDITAEQRLGHLADAVPQIVWTTDSKGRVNYLNSRWFEFTGYMPKDRGPDDLAVCVHPDDRAKRAAARDAALARGTNFEVQYRLKRHDGVYHWFLTRGVPVRNESGGIIGWFGTCTDIHDQKQAAEDDRFLAEASRVLSSSLDYEVTLGEVSRMALAGLADWCAVNIVENGKLREPLIAQRDSVKADLVRDLVKFYSNAKNVSHGIARVMETGESELFENVTDETISLFVLTEEDFEIIKSFQMKSLMVVPLVSRGQILGTLSLASVRADHTFNRQSLAMAEELGRRAGIAIDNARLYRQAQNAIQARDQFLSIASHELKTPITSLTLQLQMTKKAVVPEQQVSPTPQKLAKVLDITTKQVQRLTGLVNDLMDVSRIRAGKLLIKKSTVNLGKLVRDQVDRLQEEFQRASIPVEVSAPPEVVGLWDSSRLEQVVVNLLSNAIKYAPGAPLSVKVFIEGGMAVLEVTDHGPGIPPEFREKLFDRFERAEAVKGVTGLGLGLFIVKQIILAHQGTIKVESTMKKGTSFIVRIPLWTGDQKPLNSNMWKTSPEPSLST